MFSLTGSKKGSIFVLTSSLATSLETGRGTLTSNPCSFAN